MDAEHAAAAGPKEAPTLHVACLCAAWCRTCDAYRPVFEQAVNELAEASAGSWTVRGRWIDIEDEADLVGDLDIDTFPTLLVADARGVRFAGPLTPEPATLRRLLQAMASESASSRMAEADAPMRALARALTTAG